MFGLSKQDYYPTLRADWPASGVCRPCRTPTQRWSYRTLLLFFLYCVTVLLSVGGFGAALTLSEYSCLVSFVISLSEAWWPHDPCRDHSSSPGSQGQNLRVGYDVRLLINSVRWCRIGPDRVEVELFTKTPATAWIVVRHLLKCSHFGNAGISQCHDYVCDCFL
jgi:hypothetical protein